MVIPTVSFPDHANLCANADTISNLIEEVKRSLEIGLAPEDGPLVFNYTVQSFVSQQQLEAINGGPFVFSGTFDFDAENDGTFMFDTTDS